MESVSDSGDQKEFIRKMILTTLELSLDDITTKDIKTLYSAFQEIRYALTFFDSYSETKKVSVFGSARTDPSEPIYAHAVHFAREMAQAGFMLITGAGDGIMRAAQDGAGPGKSFGLNILLPFEQAANEFIENDPKLIKFKYFFTRKLFFVKEADALTFFPGGFGTHDEGFEALTLLQTGKCKPMPVVFIDLPNQDHWKALSTYITDTMLAGGLISPEDLNLFKITNRVEDAVHEIINFYRNYHSMTFVDDQTMIRLNRPLNDKQMDHLNDLFSDIVLKGKIIAAAEGMVWPPLSGIVFHFNRRNFGRFREMINTINTFSLTQENE